MLAQMEKYANMRPLTHVMSPQRVLLERRGGEIRSERIHPIGECTVKEEGPEGKKISPQRHRSLLPSYATQEGGGELGFKNFKLN